jgi:hypothetical protein
MLTIDQAFQDFITHLSSEWTKAAEGKPWISQHERVACYSEGQKYWRVVRGNSAWCFVCRETGDILKADGWKKPAKGARGSVLKPEGWPSGEACAITGWLYRY